MIRMLFGMPFPLTLIQTNLSRRVFQSRVSHQSKIVKNHPDSIPTNNCRLTHASWKFKSGAIGTLTHGIILHGEKYDCKIEVWADGFQAAILDPYDECTVIIRNPSTGTAKCFPFELDINSHFFPQETRIKFFLSRMTTVTKRR
jgi:hypothetical protein